MKEATTTSKPGITTTEQNKQRLRKAIEEIWSALSLQRKGHILK